MELDGFLEWKIVGYVIGAMCVSVNVIIYVVLHEMKSGVLEYILLGKIYLILIFVDLNDRNVVLYKRFMHLSLKNDISKTRTE